MFLCFESFEFLGPDFRFGPPSSRFSRWPGFAGQSRIDMPRIGFLDCHGLSDNVSSTEVSWPNDQKWTLDNFTMMLCLNFIRMNCLALAMEPHPWLCFAVPSKYISCTCLYSLLFYPGDEEILSLYKEGWVKTCRNCSLDHYGSPVISACYSARM